MTRTVRVLVLCAGNICRSPVAAAVLARLATEAGRFALEVRSRGTHDWNAGAGAHPAMAAIAAARGYDLGRHVAAQVSPADLAWADEVLVMDEANRADLAARHPAHAARARLLDAAGIPDPWLSADPGAFAAAFDQVEAAVRAWLAAR
jgi:protein-tyrosine phosphatase